jgi:CDK inhibitor PHO81
LHTLISIIKPLEHAELDVGRKVDPYWKSTLVVNQTKPNSEYGIQSLITATSLSEEYIQLSVQVTRDLVPVVSTQPTVTVFGLKLPISSMECDQYMSLLESLSLLSHGEPANVDKGSMASHQALLRNNYSWINNRSSVSDIAGQVNSWNQTLAEVLHKLNASIGLCINIIYDSTSHVPYDDCVDAVLRTVYDETNGRSILFSSYDSAICERLNWKQPNYGVLMGLKVKEGNQQNMSIKEAIHVAKNSNLLGLIVDAEPLVILVCL